MYQHDYDNSGLASSYLLLTLALPVTLYQCYLLWIDSRVHPCRCENCIKKKRGISLSRMMLAAASFLAVSYLVHNILTIQIARRSAEFDPFTALNVGEGASASEVKKAYKKTVRRLNMKLKVTKTKEATTAAIMNANRAYKILKDPSTYERWLSEGVEKKLVIAMPAFLIRSSVRSLGAYILVLGIIIPFIAYRKYYAIKYKCITGAYYESVERLYERLDSFSDSEELLLPQLLSFISRSIEFTSKTWRNEIPDIKKEVEGVYAVPLVGNDQGYLHIMDYLCRTGHAHVADAEYVRLSALGIIDAGVRIAIEESRNRLCSALLVLRKMFIQAVPAPEYYLMQFPGIKPEHIRSGRSAKPAGTGIPKECSYAKGMGEFIKTQLRDEESRNALAVLNGLPRIALKNITAFTLNTEQADTNLNEDVSSVTERDGNTYKIEKGSTAYVSFKLVRKGGLKICHMPRGQGVLRNAWTVYYQINSEIQKSVFILDDFEGEKDMKLTLPMQDGTGNVRVHVVSNGYFGIDASDSLIIKYY